MRYRIYGHTVRARPLLQGDPSIICIVLWVLPSVTASQGDRKADNRSNGHVPGRLPGTEDAMSGAEANAGGGLQPRLPDTARCAPPLPACC